MAILLSYLRRGTIVLATVGAIIFFLGWPHSIQAAPPQQDACDWSGDTYDDFYDPPPLGELTPDRLGELLRVEHVRAYTRQQVAREGGVQSSEYGAELYLVLYLSQSPAGVPRAVSGVIAIPTGTVPDGGFPVAVFGPGTTGMADKCAPSKQPELTQGILMRLISQGYIVSATDFVGLGTPGFQPYGIGEAAASSMLDAGRAALNFCDSTRGIQNQAANEFFLVGHSQGGQAALFGHELWPEYAPELNLKGTVVFAPGAEPKFLLQQMAKQALSARIAPFAMALVAFSQYYGSPMSLLPWIKLPYANTLPTLVENQCVGELVVTMGVQPSNVFQPLLLDNAITGQWSTLEPLNELIDRNTPGNFSSDVPVLLIHGQPDQTVPVATSQMLLQRLCRSQTPASLSRYPGGSHFGIMYNGGAEALSWLNARRAGEATPSQCAEILAPWAVEPVVLKGADVAEFIGADTDELFAYAYSSTAGWRQVPLQIDSVSEAGLYTATSGVLDANDEIVFMAHDLGEDPGGNVKLDSVLPIQDKWYVVDVNIQGDPSKLGRIYLVRSSLLVSALPGTYVQYLESSRQIAGNGYRLGLSTDRRRVEDLFLNSDVDILDRIKLRFDCNNRLRCPITEDTNFLSASEVITGPVRLVTAAGDLVAYNNRVYFTNKIGPPGAQRGNVRLSFDFNAAATGATLANALQTELLAVDGVTDTVPATPASSWWQFGMETGTLVQLTDATLLDTTATNYYADDNNVDFDDTGDRRRIGDFGIQWSGVNSEVTLRHSLTFLAGVQPNAGAAYADAALHPLQVEAKLTDGSQIVDERHLYLPSIAH